MRPSGSPTLHPSGCRCLCSRALDPRFVATAWSARRPFRPLWGTFRRAAKASRDGLRAPGSRPDGSSGTRPHWSGRTGLLSSGLSLSVRLAASLLPPTGTSMGTCRSDRGRGGSHAVTDAQWIEIEPLRRTGRCAVVGASRGRAREALALETAADTPLSNRIAHEACDRGRDRPRPRQSRSHC